jgi:hypothetical protein
LNDPERNLVRKEIAMGARSLRVLLIVVVVLLGWNLLATHAKDDNTTSRLNARRCVGIAVSGDGHSNNVYRAFDDGSVEATRVDSGTEILPGRWQPVLGRN